MNRKFLLSFLLLTFSFVNFLQAQNMWEEFHLIPEIENVSYAGKNVWLGYADGAIRLDTTNWSYEYFNYTAKPQMMLSSVLTGNLTLPKVYSVRKNQIGGVDFFQNYRALRYDGNNFVEDTFPGFVNQPALQFYDSTGTMWNYDGTFLMYNQGGSWSYSYSSDYALIYIDTNNCFIAQNLWGGGYNRICGPNNIDTFILPVSPLFSYPNMAIDAQNNQWYWIPDSMKLYKYDGTTLTTFGINFPNGDTALGFIPLKDNSVLFTNFNNYYYSKLAYIFDSNTYVQVDTTLFGSVYDYVGYSVSPSGRIFALVNGSSGINSPINKIYSSIDGQNWQSYSFNDLDIKYWSSSLTDIFKIDSLGDLFDLSVTGLKKFGSNWSEQFCPTNISLNSNFYQYSSGPNGICWIQKNIDSVTTKFYKWSTLTNQVDSFSNMTFTSANSSDIISANDNKFWMTINGWDTLGEYDGTGITTQYNSPSIYPNGWAGNDNYDEDFYKVIGNSFYNTYFFANYDSGHLFKFENGIVTDLCPTGVPKITSFSLVRDHQNNLWTSSATALYKWNGTNWDSIPLPFSCMSCFNTYDPIICFNNQDDLFIFYHGSSGIIHTHLYKYTNPTWTEFPLPTPITWGQTLFSKDGFLWTFNGQSLLRFDQNGFPNLIGSSYIVKGKAYHDLNANNIQNTNESGKQNVLIQSSSGDFSFTQYLGNYLLLPDSGQNTITCTPPLYYTVTPATVTVNNTGANPVVDSVDFALQPLPGMNDLSVDVTHYPFTWWSSNPGMSYWVTVKNPGTTVQSATLTFNVPDTLVIAYVSPTPTSTNGNQLTWSLNNLAIDTSLQFYIAAAFQTPTPIGSTLIAIAEVQSANTDLTPANNIDTVSYLVTGPYDPNMKLVEPMGEGALGITDTAHHVFTYIIYFQNTGNDTAVNVRVDDFLDADFDWTSFNLISGSSPVDFDLNQNGLLRFHFNNIFLPDSNVNEPMSHGFVKYSLRLKSGPSLGKQLTNAASIYFDYQPPIFTNSTLNTIGMETGMGAVSYNSNSVTLFPNPSDGLVTVLSNGNKMKFIAVYDLSGRLCYTQEASTNQATINIQSLAQGLYLVKIKLQNGATELKKLVKE